MGLKQVGEVFLKRLSMKSCFEGEYMHAYHHNTFYILYLSKKAYLKF